MKLVIVESPGKVANIQKYLGNEYKVVSTKGHIRDLATTGKGRLGLDVNNGYAPTYVINPARYQVVNDLKKLVKGSKDVILATDPDREGEAIAWHVATVLGLDINTTKRVEFNEITKETVTREINNPRTIDMDLVRSQEARRILDRIIGFGLSDWIKKIAHSESAGRVQSPALRLVCEQDEKIASFVPENFYIINVEGVIADRECHLIFDSYKNNKDKIKDESIAISIIDSLGDSLRVSKVEQERRVKKPIIPFETSSLQSEASTRLACSTSQIANFAQQLYNEGYITYIRTDSTRLSPVFIDSAYAYITNTYGHEYVGSLHHGTQSEFMQDAHEAIRPTSSYATPASVKNELKGQKYRLYELIYNRTLASLMKPKVEEVLTITFNVSDSVLHYDFVRTSFDGYSILNNSENDYSPLPMVKVGDVFTITEKGYETKSTEPPAHYSEGKLTDIMKKEGIGRPSTYATTINTLKERNYVNFTDGELISTEKGNTTCEILKKYFPEYVDTKFTAQMEEDLDAIGSREKSAEQVISEGAETFYATLTHANETAEKLPRAKKQETGELCPECGHPLVYQQNKKDGTTFVACSNYPHCKYTRSEKPANSKQNAENLKICPACHTGHLVQKKGAYGLFYACDNPECNHTEGIRKKKKTYYKK